LVVCLAQITHQEVVVPILGASAGLGGLMLVFLGLLINVNQGLPRDSPKAVRDRVKTAAWRVFGVFAASVLSVGMALSWLVIPGGDCFFWVVVGFFAADLMAIVAVAALTTKRLLR
jgi:uncharacterized membrane protein